MVPVRTSPRRQPRWMALLAAFVLLAQGLWPASAMARPAADGGFFVQMCTPHGLQTLDQPVGPAEDQAQDCCGLCVFAVAAALPGATAPHPVLYTVAVQAYAPPGDEPSPRARGPPRPPSQGPPRTA